MKVQPPRNYPGAQDRSFAEYQKWIIAVSTALGVSPPASLEEVGEQSIIPALSRIKHLESTIENLERKITSMRSKNQATLNRLIAKIDDLERSI